MRLKLQMFVVVMAFAVPCISQVQPAAQGGRVNLSIGGGVDYWRGDWGNISRLGPSAWASAELWHGLGINAEGHSMLFGGDSTAQEYKYVVGEGGVMYTYHHWRNFAPYAKGEFGFASLGFPHKPTATYAHDTRTTWAFGGGAEYRLWKHIWARGDYTYDGFPDFYSSVSGQHHTLNPGGFAGGLTYHFRR